MPLYDWKTFAKELKDSEQARSAFHRVLLNESIIHSCLNCIYSNKQTLVCEKYNQVPPMEVIVTSCGSGWEQDIPF